MTTDPTPTPEQPRTNADCPLCGKSIYNSTASWKGHFLVTHAARPEPDEAIRARHSYADGRVRPWDTCPDENHARDLHAALATPPPVPAAPGLDEGLLAAVMLERGLSMQHVHGVIDTYRARLSPDQKEDT